MNFKSVVKNGMVWVVLLALSSVGCNGAAGNCSRTEYWDEKEMRQAYLDDWVVAFAVDEEGNPTQALVVHKRINELEKYCWQTRIKH